MDPLRSMTRFVPNITRYVVVGRYVTLCIVFDVHVAGEAASTWEVWRRISDKLKRFFANSIVFTSLIKNATPLCNAQN